MAENNCSPSALIGAKRLSSHQFVSPTLRGSILVTLISDKEAELQEIGLQAQSHIVSE